MISRNKTQCYDDLALSGKEKRYPVLFYVCGGGGSPAGLAWIAVRSAFRAATLRNPSYYCLVNLTII